MKRSWLVQRLQPPADGRLGMLSNAFSFGGGLRNGGLSDEAMSMLRACFRFDYMGSAEFEWGAVPKALQTIAAHKLTSSAVPVEGGCLYVICDEAHLDEVSSRVATWASDDLLDMKENPRVRRSLQGSSDVVGWLELDNGFFVFADPQMFSRVAGLFGVSPTTVPS